MDEVKKAVGDALVKGGLALLYDAEEFRRLVLEGMDPGTRAYKAHLDPAKRGRCMCELFGAYGWAEGNRLGKWLTDYMLVRGVNNLVPHAFDAKAFPDADCPPHFCAETPRCPSLHCS